MADKKISDFTAVTTLADADLLEIETSGGNSRKITVANARASIVSGWALIGAGQTATGIYDFAVDGAKANIDFTGLSSVTELLVILSDVTTAASGVRSLQVSVDNGSTFYSTTGNYSIISTAAVKTNTDAIGFHNTSATAARSMAVHILNMKGAVKIALSGVASNQVYFTASASDINAIRILNIGGGGNITGGTVHVYGR